MTTSYISRVYEASTISVKCFNGVMHFKYMLKHHYEWCMENTVQGVGWVANTAWGKAECYIWHETPPQVLYFPVHQE